MATGMGNTGSNNSNSSSDNDKEVDKLSKGAPINTAKAKPTTNKTTNTTTPSVTTGTSTTAVTVQPVVASEKKSTINKPDSTAITTGSKATNGKMKSNSTLEVRVATVSL